jgi:outer membrane protein OmpA-like peptidoglycan-associated protein
MNISGKQPRLFAGPIFIIAAIMLAGAGVAQAACADAIAAFNNAIAAHQMEAAIGGLDDISDNPGKECLGRLAEYRSKLVDFLLEYASTPGIAPAARVKAIEKAERIVEVSGHWQGKLKIADYYLAQKTLEARVQAHDWYMKTIEALDTPGAAAATDQQRKELTFRLAAAQSLANDDKGGQQRNVPYHNNRAVGGGLSGIYSVSLRVAGVRAVPVPINFDYNQATFTKNGEQAIQELIEAAKDVPAMTLVGHTDPRGSDDYNMELSKSRVYAVRDRLVKAGVPANKITVRWRGKNEPFDTSVLPDPGSLSNEDVWQLDRRVVWTDRQ